MNPPQFPTWASLYHVEIISIILFCKLFCFHESFYDSILSVSAYVEQKDTGEVINITKLNKELSALFEKEKNLYVEIEKITPENVEPAFDGMTVEFE